MNLNIRTVVAAAVIAAGALPAIAHAQDSRFMVRVGAHNVDPGSGSDLDALGGATVAADSAASLTLNLDIALTPNLTLDILGAYPFKHDLTLNGDKIGSTKHLPPTVTLQYRFVNASAVTPYVGAGVNYTMFFSENLDALDPALDLKLDDSFGLAGQAGVDFALNERWLIGVDVRYMDLDTKASIDGAKIGTVAIDPWVYGANIGYRF